MKTINSFRSKLLALTLALMASVSLYAKDGYPDFQVDELYYNFLEGDSVQVTFLMPPTIPTEVAADTSNKKNVSGAGYVHLTEIVIPSTVIYEDKTYHVTRIGHGAFMYCPNLMHIDLPTSIKSIGEAAFHNCRYLSSITLNEGLESIEQQAFWNCSTLKEVSLPSTLKSLKQKVFYDSKALSKVICKALVPPSVEKDLLTGTDNYNASIIPNATLYVPASSLTTYQNTYPWNTFGQILSIEDSLQNIFPTLAGLQRTHTIEMYDHVPNDGKRSGGYPLPFASVKDTVINGKTYLQFGDYVNGSDYSLFFLREENNKLLIYSSILQNDLVLYDYTLELGDSLPAITSDHDYFSDDHFTKLDKAENIFTYVVTDVSTVTLLDGIERKKWILKNKYLPIIEYVEGIGCYSENTSHSGDFFRLIHDHPYRTEYVGDHLVCVSKNGQLLYSMTQEEMNSFTLTCECLSQSSYKSQWCDTWNVMEHDMGMTSDTEETWRHYLANDTIINGQTYTSVNYYWTLEESKVYKIAHVRFSEDKKVYALMDDTEYLVYDFSVQVGDTIETIVGAFSGSMLQQLLVHQIDIDGATNRKTITLYPICRIEDDEYDEDWVYLWDCCPVQWIEGVGSTDGFLMGYPPCGWVGGIGHKLLCAYKDDELQYINDLYQDDYGCEYNAVGQNPEDLFPTLWGLQRTDVELHTTGDDEAYRSVFNEYVPTLVNGKWYLYDGRNYLREENNQVLLYAPDVEIYEDIVLYDWTLEVGDTLPYHNKSVYRKSDYIVTDVSTITLLDGKEYKKWTLACGYEYIESIGAINGHGYGLFLCLPHYGHWATYIHTSLVCASRNGQLLYQMDEAEMERLGAECLCEYNSGPKKDNAKNGKIGGRPTPTQWNMLEVETKEMDGTPTILRAETFSYTLENDSIVTNGKTFYQLVRQSTKDTAITKSFVGALHFGEDEDNRVYFLRDGVEYVLYDFTAEPGDTIEIFAGINNYPQETTYTHVVVDKDTTEDGACRMFLEVVFPDETTTATNAEKVWLAGLGSIDGIVHNAAQRTSDAHAAPARSASSETQTSVMLCAWREDSCLYTTNHPEYDTFGCVYNQDPTAVEDVETSGYKYQKIIRDGHLYILRDNKLYDVLGTPMN